MLKLLQFLKVNLIAVDCVPAFIENLSNHVEPDSCEHQDLIPKQQAFHSEKNVNYSSKDFSFGTNIDVDRYDFLPVLQQKNYYY